MTIIVSVLSFAISCSVNLLKVKGTTNKDTTLSDLTTRRLWEIDSLDAIYIDYIQVSCEWCRGIGLLTLKWVRFLSLDDVCLLLVDRSAQNRWHCRRSGWRHRTNDGITVPSDDSLADDTQFLSCHAASKRQTARVYFRQLLTKCTLLVWSSLSLTLTVYAVYGWTNILQFKCLKCNKPPWEHQCGLCQPLSML